MKKRITTAVIALLLVLCLLWVPSMAEEPAPAEFMAGYAQVDITPTEILPMAGYGSADRVYTEIETNLYITAIAMTDKYDTTALLLSVDSYNTNQQWSNAAKTAIVTALDEQDVDMDIDRIYISATTTMSAPEMIYSGVDPEMKAKVDAYREGVIAACATAAVEAYEDRVPVTMYHNDMDASEAMVHLNAEKDITVADGDVQTRLNYNNHYNVVKISDSSKTYVAGVGFGPQSYINHKDYEATEVAQPDDTMGLLIFRPKDGSEDIVLVNWSAKANISSSGVNRYGVENYNKLSADYVGFFRDAMSRANKRTAFFQGTSGNVSAFPQLAKLRNPDVMEDVAYTEEVDGETVNKTASSITPEKYGELLAELALHGLAHEEGEEHLHAADMDAPINNYKFRFAAAPDLPTDTQVELVNVLKMTEAPVSVEEGEDEVDPGMAVYASLYEYLVGNWAEAKPIAVQMLQDAEMTALAEELEGLVKATQLTGIATRMSHTVNELSTNFATDSVYCDATVLQLGKMTFVMAPAELYDHYGMNDTKTWEDVGAHFVLGNTNGASGYLPNAASFHYNEDNSEYITGTNNTWATAFPEGAGETLMETYANVKKTMTATVDDENNQIWMQCECGAKEEDFDTVTLPDHEHELKEFYPWYDPDSLPVSGNYYLMTDVTILREARTGTAKKSIDLNGHTITRKVLKEVILDQTGEDVPANHYYQQSRLFALEQEARLTITDTKGGGKLTRDISQLNGISADEQKKITNYGLLVAIIDGNTSEFILYNGILDATGQYSCGGACVANMSKTATFTMYDGQLLGGISDRGAAVYANGTNNLYGGTITGGEVKDTADDGDVAEKNGSVNLLSAGKLLLAGNATIEGGKLGTDDCNLVINNAQSLSVDENYTGSAGISVKADDPNGTAIGWLENVPESAFDNLIVDNYPGYVVTVCNRNIVTIAEIRTYCACGGKAEGKHDHTCEDIQWKPWPVSYDKYLPDSDMGGNYYLLTDINLVNQKVVGAELRLDLNGHTVTHVITPAADATMEDINVKGTRVFYIGANGSLSITDSTNTPGTVKRDLSKLTDEQKNGITNYGIIAIMNEETTGDFVLYDGVLDVTGQITGGGALANLNKNLAIRIYGGEVKGGIAPNGGCIYSQGSVWLHGGTLTGGQSTGNGAGGIIITSSGSLYLCGDATVTGNTNKNGEEANIKVNNADQFTVEDDYEGEAGVILNAKPVHGMKVAKSNAVDLSVATITGETYTEGYELRVVDGYIVTYMDAAYITAEDGSVTYYKELQGAFTAYPGGKATITLQRPVEENDLQITQLTYLDLAGFNVANTGFTANGNKLYVFDSETDDYTVENGNGYGRMTGAIAETAEGLPIDSDIVTAVKPTDEYVKITENDGTSFHRLNLRFAGITLRPDSDPENGTNWPGLYYNSQFGGDEVIKRNIISYGVGMSAIDGEVMFTRDKSYTEIAAENWQVGADKNGNSNNLQKGTILTGIMKATNPTIINRRNGNIQVRGQNYVMLKNGTRVVGPEVSYSLKDVFEGNGMTGVDEKWDSWGASTQTSILNLFKTYNTVMNYWDIPNIKEAAAK